MKVISRGIQSELQTYTASCGKCDSVLEFQKNEARVTSDRNETIYVVNCPVCRNDIWIASHALKLKLIELKSDPNKGWDDARDAMYQASK
ncbi:hypothetical protein [Acinetobacter pullicarnis]|uniref:hypothetical protein n=1 Tax=Acinetobacter pullicarnis TaxID=2576829 RepID=UPI001E2F0DF9|nr:hypothetical protein [Acinetobacter pullicarnis]